MTMLFKNRRTVLIAALAMSLLTAPSFAATLSHFKSEAQLSAYLKRVREGVRRAAALMPPPAPSPSESVESVVVTGARSADAPSITNNQEANVDEGDIVKMHGDTMVVLRRGRLFTVSVAGAARPIDAIDAYPPGVDASGDWYDEMLISGDLVVVIGYSYSRGGTEINRFHIGRDGHLAFVDAHQLRSNDYYSARNYASRLVGHNLILYAPRYLAFDDPLAALPALRRWTPNRSGGGKFERIGTVREIYMPPDLPDGQIDAVHTVVSCDVTAPTLRCKAVSVFGPDGRTFYVSGHAVYVWLSPYRFERRADAGAASLLYRLPLDGSAPQAVGVRGAPVDQFSFREDGALLRVLIRSETSGDAMWSSTKNEGVVGLLNLPLASFGDGTREAERRAYRTLPSPPGGRDFHDRFAGDYVLYGVGNGWGPPRVGAGMLYAAPVRGGEVAELALGHGVDRIEVMGSGAVVVGSDDKNLYFSSVPLKDRPSLGDRYVLEGAAQSETRSHGFFFNPDAGGDSGLLGLPIARAGRGAWRQLTENSAAVLFLRYRDGRFRWMGELGARPEDAVPDNCVASCVDWYGNARPIFLHGRILALMGYELVEGTLDNDAIRETARADFAPGRVR
jgi:Beta propeller domain